MLIASAKTLERKGLINYMLNTHGATCNLSSWNNEGNDIYKKD